MKTHTIHYADCFDMETAIFDEHRRFFNSYKRTNIEKEANSKRLYRLMNGEVHHARHSSYHHACPVTMFDNGCVLLESCDDHERRGRYTFGGYDFTVVSTTNDRLFSLAVKFMSVIGRPGFKVTAASLSLTNENKLNAQTLLIDHNRSLVHLLGGAAYYKNWHPEDTHDNVSLFRLWEGVPQWVQDKRPVGYFQGPGEPFMSREAIRVTYLDTKRKKYDEVYDACRAWNAMEGNPSREKMRDQLVMQGLSPAPTWSPVPWSVCVEKGFAGLSNYERARVAQLPKAQPRDVLRLYQLAFDNEGFMKEMEKHKK